MIRYMAVVLLADRYKMSIVDAWQRFAVGPNRHSLSDLRIELAD